MSVGAQSVCHAGGAEARRVRGTTKTAPGWVGGRALSLQRYAGCSAPKPAQVRGGGVCLGRRSRKRPSDVTSTVAERAGCHFLWPMGGGEAERAPDAKARAGPWRRWRELVSGAERAGGRAGGPNAPQEARGAGSGRVWVSARLRRFRRVTASFSSAPFASPSGRSPSPEQPPRAAGPAFGPRLPGAAGAPEAQDRVSAKRGRLGARSCLAPQCSCNKRSSCSRPTPVGD